MSSLLETALSRVGVTPDANGAIGAALGLTKALTDFGSANNGLPTTGVGGQLRNIIESNIPPIFRTNPVPGGTSFAPKSGEWTALHYADDLVAHHPKFKFIFKVKFEGFDGIGNDHSYHYVHRCDKPNVTLNHTDVNYYNFRTRVLTSVVFQPISMTFLDEIGNSVNDFFVKYMAGISGQGAGSHGIQNGFGASTSSKPYKHGYSSGKAIIINQIFANGLYTNQFKFVNPRIENFSFDELNMEDNAGSLVTLQFSYDSLVMNTYAVGEDNDSGIYTWGNTDILRGGGTSGLPNAGATSLNEAGKQAASSASGGSLIAGLGLQKYTDAAANLIKSGLSQLNSLPNTLKDLVTPNNPGTAIGKLFLNNSSSAGNDIGKLFLNNSSSAGNDISKLFLDSKASTVDINTAITLSSIQDGSNFSTVSLTDAQRLLPDINAEPQAPTQQFFAGDISGGPSFAALSANTDSAFITTTPPPKITSGGGGDFAGGGATGSWAPASSTLIPLDWNWNTATGP
jgi:hypothetical protein